MLAQDRTAQLSPRAVFLALAAVTLVVLAMAAGLVIHLATTSSVAAPQGAATAHSQVSTSGAAGSCMWINGHKAC
jgi:hypothetical protein